VVPKALELLIALVAQLVLASSQLFFALELLAWHQHFCQECLLSQLMSSFMQH
jgi:hypothetical protein